MYKKITTILLSVMVMISFMPFAAFAEEPVSADGTDQIVTEQADGTEEVIEVAAPEEVTPEEVTDEGEEAQTVTAQEDEEASISLTATATSATTVSLTWTATGLAEGATFTVYQGDTKLASDISDTSYDVSGLTANTAYTFKVVSGDTTGSASVTTPSDAPAAVTNLKKFSHASYVALTWTASSGASYYYVRINGGSPIKVTGTSYNHTPGMEYNTASGPVMRNGNFTYSVTAVSASGAESAAATVQGDVIKTLFYKITFKKAATLTSHSGGSKKVKFKKGQVVYARGFSNGKYIFDYMCSDGKIRTFYTMKIRVKAKLSGHIVASKSKRGTSSVVYTAEEATTYVNEKGVTSQKNYMIYVNLYTQKEYIFYSASKGKKHDWKLIQGPWQISSGRATMPTATGSAKIVRKLKSQHGTPLWNVTKYFSIHGKQKKWPTPGYPESGACVRNTNDHAKWIYPNIPKYTRVFVY